MEAQKCQAVLSKINKSVEVFNKTKLTNPFYGKELYFFKNCSGPVIQRNQLFGYLGAFSGNNKKLTSKIDYGVLSEDSYKNLTDGYLDEDSLYLFKLINHKKNQTSNPIDKIRDTVILSEKMVYKKVLQFISSDNVKVKQYNRINFKL